MKIIKEGNINSYRHTCPYCGCEYEYEDKDVQFTYQYSSTGMKAYVTCPCCKLSNEITQYNPKMYTPYPWYNPVTMYCSDNQCQHITQYPDVYTSDYNCKWCNDNKEDK